MGLPTPAGFAVNDNQCRIAFSARVAASPDGLRWKIISRDVPQRHQHESKIFWDESIQEWVAYSQHSHHWHHGPRIRQMGRQTSKDFIHWSPKEVVLSTDWDPTLPPDREFHDGSVRKVGSLYVAIVAEAHTEPVWNSRTETVRGMHAGMYKYFYLERVGEASEIPARARAAGLFGAS